MVRRTLLSYVPALAVDQVRDAVELTDIDG